MIWFKFIKYKNGLNIQFTVYKLEMGQFLNLVFALLVLIQITITIDRWENFIFNKNVKDLPKLNLSKNVVFEIRSRRFYFRISNLQLQKCCRLMPWMGEAYLILEITTRQICLILKIIHEVRFKILICSLLIEIIISKCWLFIKFEY